MKKGPEVQTVTIQEVSAGQKNSDLVLQHKGSNRFRQALVQSLTLIREGITLTGKVAAGIAVGLAIDAPFYILQGPDLPRDLGTVLFGVAGGVSWWAAKSRIVSRHSIYDVNGELRR